MGSTAPTGIHGTAIDDSFGTTVLEQERALPSGPDVGWPPWGYNSGPRRGKWDVRSDLDGSAIDDSFSAAYTAAGAPSAVVARRGAALKPLNPGLLERLAKASKPVPHQSNADSSVRSKHATSDQQPTLASVPPSSVHNSFRIPNLDGFRYDGVDDHGSPTRVKAITRLRSTPSQPDASKPPLSRFSPTPSRSTARHSAKSSTTSSKMLRIVGKNGEECIMELPQATPTGSAKLSVREKTLSRRSETPRSARVQASKAGWEEAAKAASGALMSGALLQSPSTESDSRKPSEAPRSQGWEVARSSAKRSSKSSQVEVEVNADAEAEAFEGFSSFQNSQHESQSQCSNKSEALTAQHSTKSAGGKSDSVKTKTCTNASRPQSAAVSSGRSVPSSLSTVPVQELEVPVPSTRSRDMGNMDWRARRIDEAPGASAASSNARSKKSRGANKHSTVAHDSLKVSDEELPPASQNGWDDDDFKRPVYSAYSFDDGSWSKQGSVLGTLALSCKSQSSKAPSRQENTDKSERSQNQSQSREEVRKTVFAGTGWISPHPLSEAPTGYTTPPQSVIELPARGDKPAQRLTYSEWLAIQRGDGSHHNYSATGSRRSTRTNGTVRSIAPDERGSTEFGKCSESAVQSPRRSRGSCQRNEDRSARNHSSEGTYSEHRSLRSDHASSSRTTSDRSCSRQTMTVKHTVRGTSNHSHSKRGRQQSQNQGGSATSKSIRDYHDRMQNIVSNYGKLPAVSAKSTDDDDVQLHMPWDQKTSGGRERSRASSKNGFTFGSIEVPKYTPQSLALETQKAGRGQGKHGSAHYHVHYHHHAPSAGSSSSVEHQDSLELPASRSDSDSHAVRLVPSESTGRTDAIRKTGRISGRSRRTDHSTSETNRSSDTKPKGYIPPEYQNGSACSTKERAMDEVERGNATMPSGGW